MHEVPREPVCRHCAGYLMAKPGRKPLAVPRQLYRFYCRTDLIAELELLLEDPVRGGARYGARTEYLEALIEKDLRERRVRLTTEPRARTMNDVASDISPVKEPAPDGTDSST